MYKVSKNMKLVFLTEEQAEVIQIVRQKSLYMNFKWKLKLENLLPTFW